MGYGVIGSPTVSGSVSLGSSPGTPARKSSPRCSSSRTAPSSSGPGRRPLTAVARVRIPSGLRVREPPVLPTGGSRRPRDGSWQNRLRTAPSSSGPGRRPLTAVARVRIPSGLHGALGPHLRVGPEASPAPGYGLRVNRTSRRLADGREILYFDAEPVPRDAVDTRDLPAVATRSQLRFDALLGEWVAIASHRQTRTFLPPADECPLDPSRPGRPTEIPEGDYQVVVFENRFPSLATAVDREVPPTAPGNPVAELRPGFGRCEVVCFTSDHDRVFAELPPERARLVVDVWADRTAALSALDGVAQVFCFENHGEEIGVTLSHPHGQIYAYPYLTPRVEKMLAAVCRHRESTGGDLFAEVVAAERSGPRGVTGKEHWTGV